MCDIGYIDTGMEERLRERAEYAEEKYEELVYVKCSLCDMEFERGDDLFEERCARHTIFHSKANVQHRNTTQGIPEFTVMSNDRRCKKKE